MISKRGLFATVSALLLATAAGCTAGHSSPALRQTPALATVQPSTKPALTLRDVLASPQPSPLTARSTPTVYVATGDLTIGQFSGPNQGWLAYINPDGAAQRTKDADHGVMVTIYPGDVPHVYLECEAQKGVGSSPPAAGWIKAQLDGRQLLCK